MQLVVNISFHHEIKVNSFGKKTYGNAYFLKKDVPLHPKGNQATDVASM